jgi:hypothetical protein
LAVAAAQSGEIEFELVHVNLTEHDGKILATGGVGQLYAVTTNPKVATADGWAVAHHVGAQLRDLEFLQFHPTALKLPGVNPAPLISEAVRGAGAVLLDGASRRFALDFDARGQAQAWLHQQGYQPFTFEVGPLLMVAAALTASVPPVSRPGRRRSRASEAPRSTSRTVRSSPVEEATARASRAGRLSNTADSGRSGYSVRTVPIARIEKTTMAAKAPT